MNFNNIRKLSNNAIPIPIGDHIYPQYYLYESVYPPCEYLYQRDCECQPYYEYPYKYQDFCWDDEYDYCQCHPYCRYC